MIYRAMTTRITSSRHSLRIMSTMLRNISSNSMLIYHCHRVSWLIFIEATRSRHRNYRNELTIKIRHALFPIANM